MRESLSKQHQTIITFITTKRHGLPSTPDAEEKHQITHTHTHTHTQHNTTRCRKCTTQLVAENASLSDQKLSFILSFLFPPERLQLTAAAYIFTAPNCTTTTIMSRLEPCVLNAEFQHFILRFNKNVFTLRIPLKRGDRGVKGGPKTG